MIKQWIVTWKEYLEPEGKWVAGQRTFDSFVEVFSYFNPTKRWYPLKIKDVSIREQTSFEVFSTKHGEYWKR